MASISDHISSLRGLLRQYSQAEIPFSDSYIFSTFSKAAGMIKSQGYQRGDTVSPWDNKWFPIKLVEGKSHGFPCYPGCVVMVSTVNIPKPISIKNRMLFGATTFDHKPMHYIRPEERSSKLQDEFFSNKLMYSIINNRLVVYSRRRPSAVLISGEFEDMTEFSELVACDTDGNDTEDYCYNVYTDDFTIAVKHIIPAYNLTLKLLSIPQQIPEDATNNLNNQN